MLVRGDVPGEEVDADEHEHGDESGGGLARRGAGAAGHPPGAQRRVTAAARRLDRGRIAADGRPAEVLTPENLRASFGVSGAFLDGPDGPVFVTLPG